MKQQLSQLQGSAIIVWLNHPELKTMNGKLIDVGADHVAILADNHTYIVPYTAIVAVRNAGPRTDQGLDAVAPGSGSVR